MPDQVLYREIEFRSEWLDKEKRRASVSFSSEAGIKRWEVIEILDHSAKAVDLRRLKTLGAHLFNHDPNRIVGPIHGAQISEGRGSAEVGYDDTDEGNLAFARTESGSLKGVSVGYRVTQWKKLADGEEYQLATRTVKGNAKEIIVIGTKWEPIEISSTPIPADSSVGLGRELFARSLEASGININNPKREVQKEMDEKEVQRLIREEIRSALPEAVKEGVKAALPEIRNLITEEQRPTMRMDVPAAQELCNRASAVSMECQSRVSQMIFSGKTEQEISRFIIDAALGKPDARDTGGAQDPLNPDRQQAPVGNQTRTSFTQVPEDKDFFRAFNSEAGI